MKKFPADVTKAESLTNGDINIINDPKFLPEKKESYSEIFGSGKKKTKKDSDITPRSKYKPSPTTSPYRPITHQRFINKVLHGESDHKVKTLIQTNSSDDSTSGSLYKCHICKFETSRVNVIVAHHRLSHSKTSVNWTGSDTKVIVKKPSYKARKVKTKKLFDTSKDDFSDEDVPEKKKSKTTSKDKSKNPEKIKKDNTHSATPSKRKSKEESSGENDSKKTRFTDVLLADWSEEDEEDKKENSRNNDVQEETSNKKIETHDGELKTEDAAVSADSSENSSSLTPSKNQTEKKSCFDFDEEEEGFIGMSNANTYGRKIPRVIPLKDKAELGMDLEIDELFKKKNEAELESAKIEEKEEETAKQSDAIVESEVTEDKSSKNENEKCTPTPTVGRRRRSKASKEEEVKATQDDSLAVRRSRRPGAKKSYLNEVIETIEDKEVKQDLSHTKNQDHKDMNTEVTKAETGKVENTSSSRRKQDFKNQAIDNDREELVYSDIVNTDPKPKSEQPETKKRGRGQSSRKEANSDLNSQIDSLLAETKLPKLPGISDSGKTEKVEEAKTNTTNLSFDYLPVEQPGKKSGKLRNEMKSISRMFSDSIPNQESNAEGNAESTAPIDQKQIILEETGDTGQTKTVQIGNVKFTQSATGSQKRGSIVLSTLPKTSEAVKVVPVSRQGSSSAKECLILPTNKQQEATEEEQASEGDVAQISKNVKTVKVKTDTVSPSLITTGKLKGQAIIHQKGGKYVIVTQPPQSGRARTVPAKVQSGSKVVILTNQLGEQKIITTSGLQPAKFKVEGQKGGATLDSVKDKETSLSTSPSQPSPQSVIKMVPDGKGGIMKQLTVSPKKVLLGGTKVLVSGSGSTLSSGSAVQKIALSSTGNAGRSGDFRLIENYKGSGKTVLIQGSSNASSGVVLKTATGVPRQVAKVIQNPQTVPSLKKKPKILMRASTGQGEFVMQSASGTLEAPTYVVKQKGADGKFSAQKIVRTEIVNPGKINSGGTGTKRFILSGQGANKKGESFIITTNDAIPSKVIRMKQKTKEVTGLKSSQKPVQKTQEVYAVATNSLLLPTQNTPNTESTQILQIQEQPQQPVLQTQVIAMPGPVGADGNQTYVLVSVDEHGVVQGMDNSVVAYDASNQQDQIFMNSAPTDNVILLNPQANEEVTPIFSTSSQDILAEALANTNVLEGSINNEMDSVVPSMLLPPAIPSSVVQETSITLQKPIMTPLEMPSSVTPDTSGLEPPPLPPTPTDEDVMMEESEMAISGNLVQEQLNEHKEEETNSNNIVSKPVDSQSFVEVDDNAQSSFPTTDYSQTKENNNPFSDNTNVEGNAGEENEGLFESDQQIGDRQEDLKELPREEFFIENSQEKNTFQSMPILSDEPDTSDDVQAPEQAGDQQLDLQKSRVETEAFPKILRDQEPPSSTNNEVNSQENLNLGLENINNRTSHEGNDESDPNNTLQEEKEEEEVFNRDEKEKEVIIMKDNTSMPVIGDENNGSACELENICSDVISQKRFQEETEVSSTTDEYSNKEMIN